MAESVNSQLLSAVTEGQLHCYNNKKQTDNNNTNINKRNNRRRNHFNNIIDKSNNKKQSSPKVKSERTNFKKIDINSKESKSQLKSSVGEIPIAHRTRRSEAALKAPTKETQTNKIQEVVSDSDIEVDKSNIASRTRYKLNKKFNQSNQIDFTSTVNQKKQNKTEINNKLINKKRSKYSEEDEEDIEFELKSPRPKRNRKQIINQEASTSEAAAGGSSSLTPTVQTSVVNKYHIKKNSTGINLKTKQKVGDQQKNHNPKNTISCKAPILGARLVKNSSGREPQQESQGPQPYLLRSRSRNKSSATTATTGSCVSSTGSSSRGHNRNNSGTKNTVKNLNNTNSTAFARTFLGPSTSQQATMSSDGNRTGTDNTQTNPTVKLQRSSLLPTTTTSSSNSGIDINNIHVVSGQSTSTNVTSLMASSGGGASVSSGAGAPAQQDSESDDNEVGRLQALLEARGLPPHLFGALGPRMHHLLHRTMGTSSSSKAQQLLQGLQSQDESQQLQAAIEMCQMLVMGNEDTLAGFPIKQVVPALITLLRMEHNFDIMNNACRALAYMLEALPRSSLTVVDAIPVFLEKLQVIQCMDVAEQSLTALEILSRRHNKAILQANGVSSCLTYLDFFSIVAQRAALAITANCCLNLHVEEFHMVSESLPLLARLLAQQDKKCVESVCSAFTRLVDSFQNDPIKLQEIASMDLLKNCQQLLVLTPTILNSGTFTNVVRMISVMCANCPDLAITLLKNDIASTLLYLLTGSAESINNGDVELVSRSPSELYEITCLIGELMPRLPSDGLFIVDGLLDRPNTNVQDQVQWQWRDDRGIWHSYTAIDSKIIEAAHINSDDEISLITLGRTYTIDFHSMQQINEDTGTTRPVQRKLNPIIQNMENINHNNDTQINCTNETGSINLSLRASNPCRDARIACLKEERGLAAEFIKNLFSVLYEVYSSSAGPAVRYKCLRALLRMVYFANADLLRDVLKNQIVSSHIAGMMASNDLRIVVGSLQMAEILIQKLPEVFSVHFRREGVMHQIAQLTDPSVPICANPLPKTTSGTLSAPASASALQNTSFDFDCATASTSKGSSNTGSQPKNLSSSVMMMNPKMSISMPSTSSSINQASSLPSTSSNILTMNMTSGKQILTSNLSVDSQIASSLPPNNGSLLINAMYTNQAFGHPPDTTSHTYHHDMLSLTESANVDRSQSPGQTKMSDILRRKVPPKRKSQSTSRSKSRPDETHLTQSSVLQELITTTLGTSGRNTPSSSSTSRSRFSSTSKTTSFLASLNPVRWGRQGTSQQFPKDTATSNLTKSPSNSNLIAAGNREKARQWIRDQAIIFVNRYSEQENISGVIHPASSVLSRLSGVIQKLEGDTIDCINALRELHDILIESDISPFEVNHSGLIKAMLNFLAVEQGLVPRDNRLRAFLHVFAGLPLEASYSGPIPKLNPASFNAFVAKLNGCVTQLEQFPVKVHDFPAGVGGRSNTSALKFFNTHQLKCNLQRHPDCSNLRQWKGGTVKIDPLALVQAIERYLVVRGYGGIRVDSEEDSEEDIDDTVAAVVMSQSGVKHKLQFLIGDHILPYNMTVYQAVKQYSPLVNDQSETDTDSETPIGNASVWVQQHTIYYRPIEEETTTSGTKSTLSGSSRRNGKGFNSKIFRRRTEIWVEGSVPNILSPLNKFLLTQLPSDIVMVQDASLDALCMLRIVNGLNRHWNTLYQSVPPELIINQSEFIHSKIAAKANRQLQDPLVIMTGNLPQWLQQIATACPFLFPFETRHLLFYAISFDRDRALQRLLDTAPDLNSADTSERVTPRLDKRKRAISREEILKQAEHIIQDHGHSKALLEIQYENEVGTGLGPTLEFYALVSTELQRCDLGLWNENDSYKKTSSYISDVIKTNINNIDVTNQLQLTNNIDVINNEGSLNMLIEQTDNNSYMVVSQHNEHTLTSSGVFNIENNLVVQTIDEIIPQQQTPLLPPHIQQQQSITYVNPPNGLFPVPLGKSAKLGHISRIKTKFRFLGKFIAKAIMDSRMLDLPFSIPFYRWLLGEEHSLSVTDLAQVAPEVQATLIRLQDIVRQRDLIQSDPMLDVMEKNEKIESLDLDGCPITDLGLDFVLPGHADIELRRGGRDISVTIHNLHQYISLVTHWFLVEGVYRQFEAMREGFETVFTPHRLRMFYPEELENVFCGSGTQNHIRWDLRMLQENCRTDHGFSGDSKAILYFYDILTGYDRDEQRMFLQFVTGSPRLPTGGFKSLTPPLTIVRKTMDSNQDPDDYLPSVMTCVNYLKLPEYTSREVMKNKLKMAANEGSMSFHLS